MTGDNLSWAFLFLVVVGLMIGVGIVVGMIVAGRIDALMAPRPRPKPEDPAVPAPGSSDAQGPDQEEHP
ncbi:MAG TPA: hypothetical protein VFY23_06535 [Candidatus Limnocylindrales bacterium]|nr:hypothetical protein [Candidatus Limnocylindrales bacterium]